MNCKLPSLIVTVLLSVSTVSSAGVAIPAAPQRDDKGKEEADDEGDEPERKVSQGLVEILVDKTCPERLCDAALAFIKAVQRGDARYVAQFLRDADDTLIAYVLGWIFQYSIEKRSHESADLSLASKRPRAPVGAPSVCRTTALQIAARFAQSGVLRVLLDYITEHQEFAAGALRPPISWDFKNEFPILVEATDEGDIAIVRELLEFAAHAPQIAQPLFRTGHTGRTALRSAVRSNDLGIVRLLVEFAAMHPSLGDSLFEEALGDRELTMLDRAIREGYVDIVRALLGSPLATRLRADFLNLRLPADPQLRVAMWTAIIEYRPDRVGMCRSEELAEIGRIEAAVMACNLEALKTLLAQDVVVDERLLAAMLQNARRFDRLRFERFVQELEELLQPLMVARAQAMLVQALGETVLGLQPRAPTYVGELRLIIRVLRERLDTDPETIAFENAVYRMHQVGHYGLPNQFANQLEAQRALSEIARTNIAELQVSEGVMLFTRTVAALVTMIYFEKFGSMPRK